MSTINVSFADVDDQDRSPIKAGKYPVQVEQIEVRKSESGEHPYLNWELTIIDGDHEGRKLWMITSLSPRALWNLQSVLQSFGLEDEDVELEVDDDSNLLTSPDLTGEVGTATVVNKLYEGRVQAKVTALVGGEEEKPKRKLSSKNGTKPKTKAKVQADEEDEDDEEEEAPAPKRKVSSFGGKAKTSAGKKRFR